MKLLKLPLLALLIAGIFSLAFFSCKKEAVQPGVTSDAKGGVPVTQYTALTVAFTSATQHSMTLTITSPANGTGAPQGFSVQWMTYDLFHNTYHDVWPTDTTQFCKAGFSGVPYGAKNPAQAGFVNSYNLPAGGSIPVVIGDLTADELNQQIGFSTTCSDNGLDCATQYVFRVFAHGGSLNNRSDYSFLTDQSATTSACGSCTRYGFGWWKTHVTELNQRIADLGGSITLGTVPYDATQILAILSQAPQGNGLIILAHQLIAAKLNGISDTSAADTVVGDLIVPPVGSGSLKASDVAGLTATLHGLNNTCD